MYYIGLLKHNTKDVVIFKSLKTIGKKEKHYFVGMTGPYDTEQDAKDDLKLLRKNFGYRENAPSGLGMSVQKGINLTKRLIRGYEAFRQENPGKAYHDRKFLMFMGDLEKYKVGSAPYIATLAKAYEHLDSARESQLEGVR